MNHPANLNDVDEQRLGELIQTGGVVVVDFWKPGCGPCERQAPIFQEVAAQYPDVPFAKLNVAENPRAPFSYKIKTVPALQVYKDGKLTFHRNGLTPMFDLQDAIDDALGIAAD